MQPTADDLAALRAAAHRTALAQQSIRLLADERATDLALFRRTQPPLSDIAATTAGQKPREPWVIFRLRTEAARWAGRALAADKAGDDDTDLHVFLRNVAPIYELAARQLFELSELARVPDDTQI
jgi:hypothetical protein